MTKTIVVPGLLALGFALCLVAQTEADYSGWMKDIATTKGKITKGIAAKGPDVAADATHLAGDFKQAGEFWAGRSVSDAVTLAKNAETAANDLAAAAKAGDDAKVQSSLQAINGTCAACHMAHREGSPGSFKIK
jgi:mono/diheme cytochrome c family protein